MLKPAELYQYGRFREMSGVTPTYSVTTCLMDKYLPYLLFWMPLVVIQGLQRTALLWLLFHLVAGTLVSVITQVQHNTELTITTDDRTQHYWLLNQLMTASDVGRSRTFWWWLSGGVSFHAAHHLIPSISFLYLPEVTERIDRLLARYGVSLRRHRSIFSALGSHARLIRALSQRQPSLALSDQVAVV
jgi:linoleoyl-CoA desaturase